MAKTHVLITHSAEDKIYKDELLLHLSSQKDDGKASFWDRDAISPGTEEAPELAGQLKKADIILLLLSADFFNSDYCLEVEKKAFALQKVKKVLVVPVMLRHFDLGAKYDSRATIPDRKRPILGKTWDSEDEAFNHVAQIIGDIIDDHIEGDISPHLNRPTVFKRVWRKFKRPAGMLFYLLFLVIGFSLLFMAKRNLPGEIVLTVNQVDFHLVENKGEGLWSKSLFAPRATIKDFSNVLIPARRIRFLNNSNEFADIPGSRIKIDRLSASLQPYLYLTNVYLSEWKISDSSDIQLRMAAGNSLFISVANGSSTGQFNFGDSLELNTESSVMKFGNTKFEEDLEAIVYSSVGRVNFESRQLQHSIFLDSLEANQDATHLYVNRLQFEKDMRNENGTPVSAILSATIRLNGFDPLVIEKPETFFLKFDSAKPFRIQKINATEKGIELVLLNNSIRDIRKGTSHETMESEMPSILEWLITKYKLGLIASVLAILLPFLVFIKNLLNGRN